MSQDIVADALNQVMNAKKAGKTKVVVQKYSKLLIQVLNIAKESGYLDYTIDGTEITVEINKLNEIKAVKPRYTVSLNEMGKYVKRFLPAKNFGFVIVSTNQGLMKTEEAEEKKLGGCLIAYMF